MCVCVCVCVCVCKNIQIYSQKGKDYFHLCCVRVCEYPLLTTETLILETVEYNLLKLLKKEPLGHTRIDHQLYKYI